MKENFSSLKRFPDSDYLLAETPKSKQQYVPDELYAEIEEQKENDKKVVAERSGKQLKKLQNTIMVEYNGEELPLDEFNLKYPNFFGSKKTRRSAKSEQKSTNFSESSEQEPKTLSRKKK